MNCPKVTGRQFEEMAAKRMGDSGVEVRGDASSNFFEAIEIAKNFQPVGWKPCNPTSNPVARALYNAVRSRLGCGRDELRLFSAIDTILDTKFGVDMFFQFNDVYVTIDLATYLPRKISIKADCLFSVNDVRDDLAFMRKAVAIAQLLSLEFNGSSQYNRELNKIISWYIRNWKAIGLRRNPFCKFLADNPDLRWFCKAG